MSKLSYKKNCDIRTTVKFGKYNDNGKIGNNRPSLYYMNKVL